MYNEIIKFWFRELQPKDWFSANKEIDQQITKRFLKLWQQAVTAELSAWRNVPVGRLAEIIIIDQFSRNIYRDTPKAFMYDSLALALAQEAIGIKADLELTTVEKSFLYLPFMHSESKLIHQQAEVLFKNLGQQDNYLYELKHKEIIDRFGRYPHRNEILGRKSTTEEIDFLTTPDSSF